jgi:hypothetical protein
VFVGKILHMIVDWVSFSTGFMSEASHVDYFSVFANETYHYKIENEPIHKTVICRMKDFLTFC